MRALLVQLPHARRAPSLFPIGIANIATALKEVGVEAEVLDIHAVTYTHTDVSEYLEKTHYDLIGINAFSTQYKWAKWIIAEVRRWQPQAIIILGGPLPTFNAELILEKTQADICVIGEGEETIKDCVQNLSNLVKVQGIYFRSSTGQIVRNSPRPYIDDLDSLPNTSYEVFPRDVINIYFKHLGLFGAPRSLKAINMLTSRGCAYNCNFCSRTFHGVRFRSINKVVREIGQLRDEYGIQGVLFNDELALSTKKRGYELCEKIRPLKMYWGCQGRADIVDLDLLRAMKAAGCTYVGYGVESGSQRILDKMNKKTTVHQNELAIANTLKAGMIPIVQMIYGYPGENMDTICETIEFFKRAHFYPPTATGEAELSLLTPLPGSPLYDELIATARIADEERYLLALEGGYCKGSPALVNLTDFGDAELLARLAYLEERVITNYKAYARSHPYRLLIQGYFRAILNIKAVEGWFGVVRMVLGKLVWLMRIRREKKPQ